jgi:hypothetical protein
MIFYRLLVNSPTGEQTIVFVSESGSYFEVSRVLWDERIDGALPAITLGKMARVGELLNTLADYTADHAAWMATKQAADDEAARVETIEQSAKQDATVLSLKSMTSQQLDDWFTANITTLANARALLKILFKIVIRKVL